MEGQFLMGRLCIVDGEILFQWGRLLKQSLQKRHHFSPGETLFMGETLYHNIWCQILHAGFGHKLSSGNPGLWVPTYDVTQQLTTKNY